MSVILRKKKNYKKIADGKYMPTGTTSLYLDIYDNGKRHYEFLKDLQLNGDAGSNKEKLRLAKIIRDKRSLSFSEDNYQIATDAGKKTIVTHWMQSFVDDYELKDVRNMQGALNRFKDFLEEKKMHNLTFSKLSELIIEDFQKYLVKHSNGEGAASYFNRFKKMVKRAYKEKLTLNNPAADVKTISGKAAVKDILTLEEIKLLAATPTEAVHVKNASLFCCMTGLRWVDVKNLKWGNISGNILTITQSKTDRQTVINLNEAAIKLLGNRGKKNETIFPLPSANGANKSIRAWVARAHIDKKISFHCFRHSFGTNLSFLGEDLVTIASLMGHTTTKHTERYARASAELKQRATDKLNIQL